MVRSEENVNYFALKDGSFSMINPYDDALELVYGRT